MCRRKTYLEPFEAVTKDVIQHLEYWQGRAATRPQDRLVGFDLDYQATFQRPDGSRYLLTGRGQLVD